MNNIYYLHRPKLFDQDAKECSLDDFDISKLHQDQELSAKIDQAMHCLSSPDFAVEAEHDYEQTPIRPCRADNLYDLAQEYRQDDAHQKQMMRRRLVVAAALGSIFLGIATWLEWDLRDPAHILEEEKAELYRDYTDEHGNINYGQHFLDNATAEQVEKSEWLFNDTPDN